MDNLFEAFGVEKIVIGKKEQRCYKVKCKQCGYTDKYNFRAYYATFQCKKCRHQNGEAVKEYPPITPEIVLGLEEIILTETSHISHVQKYGYPILDKKGKKRIGTNWNYIYVVEVYAGCDELDCQNYDRYEGRGKTRVDALLNLCIQLKDEIQTEVRGLFNG